MSAGTSLYAKVLELTKGQPDVEVEQRPFDSRFSVFVFRRDPSASMDRGRARDWIAHWVMLLGGLRDEIVGEGNVAQWQARALARAASVLSSTEARRAALARELEAEAVRQEREQPFDPATVEDGWQRGLQEVVSRQGQQSFRLELIRAYGGRCAISGCNVVEVLEAAHISPYRGPETNHVTNGLLLRADLHTLFDLGLLGIDPETTTVVLAERLEQSAYAKFQGRTMAYPTEDRRRPSRASLPAHLNYWKLIRPSV